MLLEGGGGKGSVGARNAAGVARDVRSRLQRETMGRSEGIDACTPPPAPSKGQRDSNRLQQEIPSYSE